MSPLLQTLWINNLIHSTWGHLENILFKSHNHSNLIILFTVTTAIPSRTTKIVLKFTTKSNWNYYTHWYLISHHMKTCYNLSTVVNKHLLESVGHDENPLARKDSTISITAAIIIINISVITIIIIFTKYQLLHFFSPRGDNNFHSYRLNYCHHKHDQGWIKSVPEPGVMKFREQDECFDIEIVWKLVWWMGKCCSLQMRLKNFRSNL